jgi:hypothetical protein
MDRHQTAALCFESHDFISARLVGQFPKASRRVNLLMGYTHIVVTHTYSIIRLASDGADASALAMMRPLVEAHLRGVWLHDAASEDEIQRLINGKLTFPSWNRILTAIQPRYPTGLFVHAERNYETMCGYTHGGVEQISRVIDAEGRILSNYPDKLVISNMRLSTGTLATHAIIVCLALDRRDAAAEIRAHFVKRFGAQPVE